MPSPSARGGALHPLTPSRAVLGGVLAAAVYAAGLAPPAAVPLGVVAGGALAAALCWLWLLAQARASRRQADPPALPPRAALRALALDDLRAHARRSQRLHGAVLSGDPRAARLQVASPIRRGRGLRLRPGRPLLTLVRRDLLGLRRQPLAHAHDQFTLLHRHLRHAGLAPGDNVRDLAREPLALDQILDLHLSGLALG